MTEQELADRMKKLQETARANVAAGKPAIPQERIDAIRSYFRKGDTLRNAVK